MSAQPYLGGGCRSVAVVLQDPEIDAKFGFLYSGYRLYYWESLEMIRKLLLAGIPVFIAVQPTGSSQAVLGEVVLVGYLFATTYFKPYVMLLDNVLAMSSLLGRSYAVQQATMTVQAPGPMMWCIIWCIMG